MSTSDPQDHFHRIVSGNARNKFQIVLGSLFVLVWFGLDVGEIIYDHWGPAKPTSCITYAPTILPQTDLLPTPNWFGGKAEFYGHDKGI